MVTRDNARRRKAMDLMLTNVFEEVDIGFGQTVYVILSLIPNL